MIWYNPKQDSRKIMLTIERAEELRRSVEDKAITEKTARASVNRFILENLRDTFCAGHPRLVIVGEEPAWSVPIVFAYPNRVFGEVGEVLVQALSGAIVGFTPPAEVYRNAKRLLP